MEELLGIVFFGFWVYCIIDVAMTDASQVRNLPKWAWLVIVVLLWILGGIGWWLFGRPHKAFADMGEQPLRNLPRPSLPRRQRPPPAERIEDESVIRARIEERDRLLARWAEEDQQKKTPPEPS